MCSRSWCSALVMVGIGTSTVAQADDAVTLPEGARLAVTLSNGQQALEAGIEYAIKGLDVKDATTSGTSKATVMNGKLFASVSVPFGSGTVVRIDKNTSDWRVNLGGDLVFKERTEPGLDSDSERSQRLERSGGRLGVTLSAGHADYTFYPGAGTTSASESHWSVAASARAAWIHDQVAGNRRERWAPQLSVTYDRSYAASTAIGIVRPAMADMPALVTQTASIAPPAASPSLTARISCPWAAWGDRHFLLGPSLSHSFAGSDRAVSPFGGDSGRLETELWLYYVPYPAVGDVATRARIGLAPFVSVRTFGDDSLDRTAYGALVELRINSNIYDY